MKRGISGRGEELVGHRGLLLHSRFSTSRASSRHEVGQRSRDRPRIRGGLMTLAMLQSTSTPFGSLWLVEKDIVSDTLNAGKHWDSHVYEALEPYLSSDAAVLDVGRKF